MGRRHRRSAPHIGICGPSIVSRSAHAMRSPRAAQSRPRSRRSGKQTRPLAPPADADLRLSRLVCTRERTAPKIAPRKEPSASAHSGSRQLAGEIVHPCRLRLASTNRASRRRGHASSSSRTARTETPCRLGACARELACRTGRGPAAPPARARARRRVTAAYIERRHREFARDISAGRAAARGSRNRNPPCSSSGERAFAPQRQQAASKLGQLSGIVNPTPRRPRDDGSLVIFCTMGASSPASPRLCIPSPPLAR